MIARNFWSLDYEALFVILKVVKTRGTALRDSVVSWSRSVFSKISNSIYLSLKKKRSEQRMKFTWICYFCSLTTRRICTALSSLGCTWGALGEISKDSSEIHLWEFRRSLPRSRLRLLDVLEAKYENHKFLEIIWPSFTSCIRPYGV